MTWNILQLLSLELEYLTRKLPVSRSTFHVAISVQILVARCFWKISPSFKCAYASSVSCTISPSPLASALPAVSDAIARTASNPRTARRQSRMCSMRSAPRRGPWPCESWAFERRRSSSHNSHTSPAESARLGSREWNYELSFLPEPLQWTICNWAARARGSVMRVFESTNCIMVNTGTTRQTVRIRQR